jgi:hypothetical protein
MLTIDLTTPNLKAPQEVIHRAVRCTVSVLTKEISHALKEELLEKLKITRPWLLLGFRSQTEATGPGAFLGTVWHRDAYLTKHEEGAKVSPKENSFLIPSEELRGKKTFKARRAWLAGVRAFQKGSSLYEAEGRKIRRVATLAKETTYDKKIDFSEVTKSVVEEKANALFFRYLERY